MRPTPILTALFFALPWLGQADPAAAPFAKHSPF